MLLAWNVALGDQTQCLLSGLRSENRALVTLEGPSLMLGHFLATLGGSVFPRSRER